MNTDSSKKKFGFNKLLNFVKKNKILSLLLIGFGGFYYEELGMLILGEKYRMRLCDEALSHRFNFSNKYLKQNLEEKEICTIYPTNSYDTQRAVEIANKYKIPIMCDTNYNQNTIPYFHFKIDFSKYDKIVNFDQEREIVTLEPGVKVQNLINYLEKYDMTIPNLEIYKYSTLTIGDILYNNFYSFSKGKFIDDEIKEILVVTPRKNKILTFKQNDDLTLTGLNMKNLFLHNNSILGMIIELKMQAKKTRDYDYLAIQNVENSIDESLNIVQSLKEEKKHLGIKDVIIVHKDKESDLILKVKKSHLSHCQELLNFSNIKFDIISKNEYLQSIVHDSNLVSENLNLRKLKISLSKNNLPKFISKAEKLAQESNVAMQFRCSYINNEIEMIIKTKEDLKEIESAYLYINKIHSLVLKAEGNIFGNFEIYFSK